MSIRPNHCLTAFGLTVGSEFDIPELPESKGTGDPDVIVTQGSIDRPADAGEDQIIYRRSPREVLLLYEVAAVAIRDGQAIFVDPSPAVPREVIRHLIIGPALNYLLHQRGYFVLHASTVAIGEAAVAFVGESGMGKTTTAMGFLCAGHRVLSDDVAAIDIDAERPSVRSGYPSIKLNPELVDRFKVPVSEPQQTSTTRNRHFHGLRHHQPESLVPLKRIYLLEDGHSEALLPLESKERILKLVENTYTVPLIEETDTAESNFQRCTSLAESVPVCRLQRRRQLEKLPRVVELVEDDLDGDTS